MYDLQPQHPFFVGVDSDGCVFDTMELKHKECFIPCFINHYELQAASKYARETWEFVNLYSKSRGVNRFPALVETLDRLGARPEVTARGLTPRTPPTVREWVARERQLGNPALRAHVEATNDDELRKLLDWSLAVNESIAAMVRQVPPFPWVRESLERLANEADLLVCSQTPTEALRAEWSEHGIDHHVVAICGQEQGSKQETLANAAKYAPQRSLMIGDAPGDQRAAGPNQCLFFPILPGREDSSWERLFREGIDRFLAGTFAGDYQRALLEEFDSCLPDSPPWTTT